jgi:hypothetical protein
MSLTLPQQARQALMLPTHIATKQAELAKINHTLCDVPIFIPFRVGSVVACYLITR